MLKQWTNIITAVIFIAVASAQDGIVVQDSICFGYQLRPGDSLIYRVEGIDSIVFRDKPPLHQRWFQRLIVVCDSVDAAGYYYFRQWIDSLHKVRWAHNDPQTFSIETTSPWLKVILSFQMNAEGWITDYQYSDTTGPLIGPSSAFQPRLWRAGAAGCWKTHRSWTIERLLEHLPENGYPPPVRQYTAVYTARYKKDSAETVISKCTFATVVKQQMVIPAGSRRAWVEATINEYGFLIQDQQWHIPRHLYTTAEARFTMWFSPTKSLSGIHYTHVNYYLESAHFGSTRGTKRLEP